MTYSAASTVDQLDILDELKHLERLAGLHVLMPNMSLACGADLLAEGTRLRGTDQRTWTTYPAHAICPACLAIPDLDERAAAMQRRQA